MTLSFAIFLLGSLAGSVLVVTVPLVRGPLILFLQARMISPINAVSHFGNVALTLLVFLNNTVPALLSFLYPFIIANVNWTPPLTRRKKRILLASFTGFCAFLVGFFGLGIALAIGWVVGGRSLLSNLLAGATVHGPLEMLCVLLCISEPLRLAEQHDRIELMPHLRRDLKLLVFCLFGLLLSAVIEVLVGL